MMPSRFSYLRSAALKYGVDAVQIEHLGRGFADTLSNKDIDDLARTYSEICRREDALPISVWLDEAKSDPERRGVWLLFVLFKQLSERNIPPFSSRAVRLFPKHRILDWTKLPESLRYLAEPAEVYGGIQFEESVARFVQNATRTQLATLAEVANRVREDLGRINGWLDAHRMTEHPEAELVYFLLQLLGPLALKLM